MFLRTMTLDHPDVVRGHIERAHHLILEIEPQADFDRTFKPLMELYLLRLDKSEDEAEQTHAVGVAFGLLLRRLESDIAVFRPVKGITMESIILTVRRHLWSWQRLLHVLSQTR
jgi:hypothetical protein